MIEAKREEMKQKTSYIRQFSSNLRSFRAAKQLSKADVARHLDLSSGSYQRYENGTGYPNTDTLIQLADFLGVSVDVLLRGGSDIDSIASDVQAPYGQQRSNLTILDQEVQAGSALQGQTRMQVIAQNFAPWLPGNDWYQVTAIGDSMVPTIQPGEHLYCKRAESAQFQPDKIYVVVTRHGAQVKRVRPIIDKKHEQYDRIQLSSDNHRITPSYLDAEDILEMYEVHEVWSKRVV